MINVTCLISKQGETTEVIAEYKSKRHAIDDATKTVRQFSRDGGMVEDDGIILLYRGDRFATIASHGGGSYTVAIGPLAYPRTNHNV